MSDNPTSNLGALLPPATTQQLEAMLEQARSIAATSPAMLGGGVIKTEEGRLFAAMHCRLLETLLHGAPKTPLPSRHNP